MKMTNSQSLLNHRGSGSARLAELFDPAAQHSVVRLLEIEKFDAHADARLNDAYHTEPVELLIFPRQRDAYTRVGRQRVAGADNNSAHGQSRSHAFAPAPGFQVQNDRVRSERIADAKAAVPRSEEHTSELQS